MTLGLDFPATLAAARVGADWAWTNLYRDLAPSVLRYLRVHNLERPDDLLEEVFLRVVGSLPDFTGHEDDFRAWVFTLAHQRIAEECRSTDRQLHDPRVAEDRPLDTAGAEPGCELCGAIDDAHVCAIVAHLDASQREVLFLRIIGRLSVEQTAQALGETPDSVKALQIRGFQAISRHLPSEVVQR